MTNYLQVLAATILLAFDFALSKKYQKSCGTSVTAGLSFNALNGMLTAAIFFFLSGCKFTFSPFSILLAFAMSLFGLTYSIIGFRILKSGNMAVYSLFLMTGGMTLPYIFGVAFLDEKLTGLRIIGLIVIIAAVVLSNRGGRLTSKEQVLLCIAVFILNGMVSIVSKCHQIDLTYGAVDSTQFVMLSGIAKFILSSLALLIFRTKQKQETPNAKAVLPIVAASALIGGVSYMLQLIGAKALPATVLYPMVTGGSIIFSAFAGKIFYKEKISKYQWISIALCFAGTCMFL